jgi:hypothetical protein
VRSVQTRPLLPPCPVRETTRVLSQKESQIDLDPLEPGQIGRIPAISTFCKSCLPTQPSKNAKQKAILTVVSGRREIGAAAVPAPLLPIVPPWEKILKTLHSGPEQVTNIGIFCLNKKIMET